MLRKRRKIFWWCVCLGLGALCLSVRALLRYYEYVSIRAQLKPGEYYVDTGSLDLDKLISPHVVSGTGGSDVRNSSRIGRELPDTRPVRCKRATFSSYLPKASIIIVHTTEETSSLVVTVYSVLLRTPSALLGEIILLDDSSDHDNVGKELSRLPAVRHVRTEKLTGLTGSRILGAREARFPVLVFLDSAAEVNIGWLEPLLVRIIQSPNSVVSPVNDIIQHETSIYVPQARETTGGFYWNLTIKYEKSEYHERDYIRSPVLVGTIFAVKKTRLVSLGLFDPDMEGTGGDTLELSLKSWMCDGDVVIATCSHVGVKETSLAAASIDSSLYIKNVRRVAEVWMDDYKRFFYFSKPSARMAPLQSVMERRAIRNQLRCKGFRWYLENVYPSLRLPVTGELAYGQIQQGQMCLDIEKGHSPAMAKLSTCTDDSLRWSMSQEGEISSQGMCLTADGVETHGYVLVHLCNRDRTQKWKIHKRHIYREGTSECLDSHKADVAVVISQCDDLYPSQSWRFFPNGPTAVTKDDM